MEILSAQAAAAHALAGVARGAARGCGDRCRDKVIPISHSPIKKLVLWAWSSIRVKLEA